MTERQIRKLLLENNVILEGHFVGTNGGHMSKYVNKDAITKNPELLDILAYELARKVNGQDIQIDVVASPAMGAIILGNYTAYYINDVEISIFCEKDESTKHGFIFKRGYGPLLKNRKVAVVEDIFNTKESAMNTIKTIQEYGGNVTVVLSILNRANPNAINLKIPEISLVTGNVGEYDIWSEDDCPLCKKGIPINTEVGHGAEFLKKKKQS